MRSRNLKPGFFSNELLGSADPLYGLLFQGLWLMADREGRLEDRPLRICAQLFPYRRGMTERRVDAILGWLHGHNFVTRYEVDGRKFIQVVEFTEHQRPHPNEQPSKIPPLISIGDAPRSDAETDQGTPSGNTIPRATRASSLNPSSSPPESKNPLTPQSGAGVASQRQGTRAAGTNPRALGTNPRRNGTNPRANGTNPRAEEWDALKKRAEACGFRAPHAHDTLETYETSLRLYERDRPRP